MSSRKRKKKAPSPHARWSADFGDVVRAARLAKGWTQGDLAHFLRKRCDRLGKNNRYTTDCTSICRMEAGRTYCGVRFRKLVAEILDIKPEDLGIKITS